MKMMNKVFAGLVLGSAIVASAQTPSTPNDNDTRTRTVVEDKPDYGWVGLLGLAGLLGMRRKKDEVAYTDKKNNVDPMRRTG